MDQRSVSASATPGIRPSFWHRLTRLSSAPSSPRPELAKQTSEQAFHTPYRHSARKGDHRQDHSDDEHEPSPITPRDVGLGSSKSSLHSRIYKKPARSSSLRTTSTHYSLEPIKLLPARDEPELLHQEDDNGHAAVLAGFLKNNGGYLDQSDSEEECPPPPPILRPRSRYIPSQPTQTRTRSIYSPVRCPDLSTSPNLTNSLYSPIVRSSSGTRSPKVNGSNRINKVVQKVSSSSCPSPKAPEVVKRRLEGQKAFRSLVLGEDDMLRLSI